jgi:hypothetical protein
MNTTLPTTLNGQDHREHTDLGLCCPGRFLGEIAMYHDPPEIGALAKDIVAQTEAEGMATPLYFVPVGADYSLRNGRPR